MFEPFFEDHYMPTTVSELAELQRSLKSAADQISPDDSDHLNDVDPELKVNEMSTRIQQARAGGIVPDPVEPPPPPPPPPPVPENWWPRAVVLESGKIWYVHAGMTDGSGVSAADPISLGSIGKLLDGQDKRLATGDVVQFADGHYYSEQGWTLKIAAHLKGRVIHRSDPVQIPAAGVNPRTPNTAYPVKISAWGRHYSGPTARALSVSVSGASVGGFMVVGCAGSGIKLESRVGTDENGVDIAPDGFYLYDTFLRQNATMGFASHTGTNVTLRRVHAELNGSAEGHHQMYLETREGAQPGTGLLLIDVICDAGDRGFAIKLGSNNPVHHTQLIGCEFMGNFLIYFSTDFRADFCTFTTDNNKAAFNTHAKSEGQAIFTNCIVTSGVEKLFHNQFDPDKAEMVFLSTLGVTHTDDDEWGFKMADESTVPWPVVPPLFNEETQKWEGQKRWWMRGGTTNATKVGLFGRCQRPLIDPNGPAAGTGWLTEARRTELLALAGHWGWRGRDVPEAGECDLGPHPADGSISDVQCGPWGWGTGPGKAENDEWPYDDFTHFADHNPDAPWNPEA